MIEQTRNLEKGQLAYRNQSGSLMILPVNDEDVRDAFITYLMHDYVEERSIEELENRLKQAGKEIMDDRGEHSK